MDPAALQALLSQVSGGAPEAKGHVEFRAGILHLDGTTVTADSRRGKVRIVDGDEGYLKFQWVLRPAGTVELDLGIFPESMVWEKVPECKDGRVYLLRFRSGGSKRFFWMQEPKDDKDEELFNKVNQIFNNPSSVNGGGAAAGGDAMNLQPSAESAQGLEAMDPQQLESLMGDLSEDEIQELLAAQAQFSQADTAPSESTEAKAQPSSTTVPSTPPPTAAVSTTAPNAPSRPTNPNPTSIATPSGSASAQVQSASQALLRAFQSLQAEQSLGDVLTLESVLESERTVPLVDDEMAEALAPFLPENQRSKADVIRHLRSPQFQQTVHRFTSLLNGHQYGALMSSLGLPNTGDIGVNAFIQAIQNEAKKENGKQDEARSNK